MKVLSPLFVAALLLTGCFSPSRQAKNAVAKTERIHREQAVVHDKLDAKGRALVYATEVALDKAPTNPPTELARTLNRQAAVILGAPDVADAVTLDKVVVGTLSEVPAQRADAAARLKKFTGAAAALQATQQRLDKQETRSEAAKDQLLLSTASIAQTYTTYKHTFWWVVSGLVGLWLLPKIIRVASIAMGGTGIIGSWVSTFLSHQVSHFVLKVPGVAEKAGVVLREANDLTNEVAQFAVLKIEALKRDPETRDAVKTALKTGEAPRPEVSVEVQRILSNAPSIPG